MKKIIIKRLNFLIVLLALTQALYSQELKTDTVPGQSGIDKEVNLTFNTVTARKTTGSVVIIDVQEELKRDQDQSIGEIINGKVPGVFNNYNTWGTGDAVLLVDGIRQDGFYINSLNPMEIGTVVILKDAVSRALYGAQGDQGVILITTKHGKSGKQELRVFGQYSAATPRALPKYLGAADYMEKYDEAQLNDGIEPSSLRYSQEAIDGTRSGANPARYPDNDFYSNDYIRDYTTTASVFADVAGGNENARYYVNTGWEENSGWLNTPQGDVTDNLSFRGNLDITFNDYLDMSVYTSARLSFNQQPNAPGIWETASTELPNNYPVLWDPYLITNTEFRDFILSTANLEKGQLLGGNSSFLNNVYGELTQNGNKRYMQRELQMGGKVNLDMRFITEGLSASLYGGMNFYNTLATNQEPTFAVYEPVFDDVGQIDTVTVHGKDKSANKYNTNSNNSTFSRHISYYGTLNYNRTFGRHAISAAAMMYTDLIKFNNELQKDVLFHTGFSANYTYANKYIAEFSLMGIGSRKLKEGNRIEMAPSIGVGWVLSEEEFMSDNSFFDYLKLRASYGITKNDNWNDYYLYKSTFTRGGGFTYQNGNYRNNETDFSSVPNDIKLQKRRDISVGLDATILDKSMNIKLGYFNSASLDNITLMSSTYPQILGFENLVYNNYNSDRTEGIELGIDYTIQVATDLSVTAGTNLMTISPKITKIEEPIYEGVDLALKREGTATDALWGLISDGLYSEADFNPDGSLAAGLPVPTFGAVQPGDIKYLDQNGDNIIDNNDQRIIGHGLRTQGSLYLDVNFKSLEFYVLGITQLGDYNYRSGSYYRVFGDVKYSEMANDAYGPGNKDVNAIHPRLSTTSASNNDRNSDYWLYKNNNFVIPTMQLTYHFSGANKLSFLKNSRIYLRADNALVFGKNKKYTEVNIGTAPKTRRFTLGIVASF